MYGPVKAHRAGGAGSEFDAKGATVRRHQITIPRQRAGFSQRRGLLIFGALNGSVKWFDVRKGASLDDLSDAAIALFLRAAPRPE